MFHALGRFSAINQLLHTGRWVPLALLVVLLLFPARGTLAAVPVVTAVLNPSSAYEVQRVYPGQVVSRRAAELGFQRGGAIAQVAVDIGARVTGGQLLARLDDARARAALVEARAGAAQARAEVAVHQAELLLSRQTLARHRALVVSGHSSRQLFDELLAGERTRQARLQLARAAVKRADAAVATAQIALDETRLEAPFDGVVQARYHDEGTIVPAAASLLRLVEQRRPEAHVGLPEEALAGLHPGMPVTFSYHGRTLTGHLRDVLPEANGATRTRTAVFELEQTAAAGDVIELQLRRSVAADGYWVDLAALAEDQRGLWSLFVVDAGGVARRHLVEVLHTDGQRAYVRGTVSAGQRVVSAGTDRIVAGQQVRAVAANAGN